MLTALALAPVRVRVRLRLRAELDSAGARVDAGAPGARPPVTWPAPWPWARWAAVAEVSAAGLRASGRGRAWATPTGWRAEAAGQATAGPLILRRWRHRTGGPGEGPRRRMPSGERRRAKASARAFWRRADARQALRALGRALADRLAWERLLIRLRVGTGEAMGTAVTAGALRAAALAATARLPGARALAARLRLEVWPDFQKRGVAVELEATASIRAGQAALAALAAVRAYRADRPGPQRARAHTAWP